MGQASPHAVTPVGGGATPPAGAFGSARRSTGRLTPTAADPSALVLEVNKLRSDLRAKAAEGAELALEVRTLKKLMAAKDAGIEAAEAKRAEAAEAALQRDVELAAARKAAAKWQLEKQRLRAEADAANAEADRLNAAMLSASGSNSRVMNGSMEDTVKLHNQLAEARREVRRLKDDAKGSGNVVAAKDAALDLALADAAAAKAALEERRADQNVIADLRRRLGETHAALGGETRLGQLVGAEVETVKEQLERTQQELATARACVDGAAEEVAAAQEAAAAAEQRASQAAAREAEALAAVAQAKRAEAEREFSPVPLARSLCGFLHLVALALACNCSTLCVPAECGAGD
jgi:hypothetical protein